MLSGIKILDSHLYKILYDLGLTFLVSHADHEHTTLSGILIVSDHSIPVKFMANYYTNSYNNDTDMAHTTNWISMAYGEKYSAAGSNPSCVIIAIQQVSGGIWCIAIHHSSMS